MWPQGVLSRVWELFPPGALIFPMDRFGRSLPLLVPGRKHLGLTFR